jgi:hypothetical protein
MLTNLNVLGLVLQLQQPFGSSDCIAAIRLYACQLCRNPSLFHFYNAIYQSGDFCDDSCEYLYASCGQYFNVDASLLHLPDGQRRRARDCNVQNTLFSVTGPGPLGDLQACFSLAAGLSADFLFRVLGFLASGSGLVLGLFYIIVGNRRPNLSFFIQTFFVVGGVFALSNAATLVSAQKITVAVLVPVLMALLPAVTSAYLVVLVRQLGFFIAGATIGVSLAGMVLSAFLQLIFATLLSASASYAGIGIVGGLTLICGLVKPWVADTVCLVFCFGIVFCAKRNV